MKRSVFALVALIPSALLAETVALVGARVHTLGAAGTLENATVILADGRITAVGAAVAIPAGARSIDAAGKVVTPGLIDSSTQIGLVEIGQERNSNDTSAADNDRLSAALDVTDALNPRSNLVAINRVEGLTHAVILPSPGESLIAGQGALTQLGHGDPVVERALAVAVVLGEPGAELAGGSRAAAFLALREALADARDFAANRAAFERGERREYALSRLDLEALVPVVRGQTPLVVTVQRASDIEAVLRFAVTERVRVILSGAAEGWVVADQIAAAGVPVLLSPLDNLPGRFETLGATLENAARLHRAGVRIAFKSGESHNARNIKQAAGNAVAYGLPWDVAFRGLTSTPAALWGVADRLGSIEPGKEATLVVWDGDPLEVTTFAERVFIRGEEMPTTTRQTELRDRYGHTGRAPGMPPAYRNPVQ
jgi:imidazolonepropionase-like amidohydrolase